MKVTVLGLGKMGAPIAAALTAVRPGDGLHDRQPEPGTGRLQPVRTQPAERFEQAGHLVARHDRSGVADLDMR